MAITADTNAVRIGVLGAARIARQFVDAVRTSTAVTVVSVAARDHGRARAFAAEMQIPGTHADYDSLLDDDRIEAVYVPLPNSLHAEWSIRALAAGKHVLCEKPLAVTERQARDMFEAATKAGRHLVEGYPYLAQPQTITARDLVRSGAIGRPRLIRTSFGVPFSDPADIRLSAELCGGSLMDAGSYAVSMLLVMAGERPSRVSAVAEWASTGVDAMLIGSLEFPSGLMGQVASSFTSAYHRHAHIAGDAGIVETTFLNHPPLGGPPVVTVRRGSTVAAEIETLTLPGGNGFLAEAEQFAALVRGEASAWTGVTAQQSIDIAATLEALLASARSGGAVTLGA